MATSDAKKLPLLANYPFSSFKRTGVVQFKITLLLEKKLNSYTLGVTQILFTT